MRRLIFTGNFPCEIGHAKIVSLRNKCPRFKICPLKTVFRVLVAQCDVIFVERFRIRKDAITTSMRDHCGDLVMCRYGVAIETIERVPISFKKGVNLGWHKNYSRLAPACFMRAR